MEFQARRSGAMVLAGNLPSFIDQMGVLPSRFTVMAHSMGNVVVSEAMRTWGSQANKIGKYLAMMSAESAGAYRYGATPIGTYSGISSKGVGPDVYGHANPQNPRNRLSVTWDRITKPFEPLDATLDGPVYYSGGFARLFGEARTYFRDNEAATGNSWVGTQNIRIDRDFAYRRILEPGGSNRGAEIAVAHSRQKRCGNGAR